MFDCVVPVARPTPDTMNVRRTWGPSHVHKKDKRPMCNGGERFSKSAPNLHKTLLCMGDQSAIQAFKDYG
jgi:hypothetical protein